MKCNKQLAAGSTTIHSVRAQSLPSRFVLLLYRRRVCICLLYQFERTNVCACGCVAHRSTMYHSYCLNVPRYSYDVRYKTRPNVYAFVSMAKCFPLHECVPCVSAVVCVVCPCLHERAYKTLSI